MQGKMVAEFTIPKAHVISESRNRKDAAKKFPPRHVYKIGCVGLRRLLNGSNARQTPKQQLSDLIDPVADTEEPEPDIRVPDTIMMDYTIHLIQYIRQLALSSVQRPRPPWYLFSPSFRHRQVNNS